MIPPQRLDRGQKSASFGFLFQAVENFFSGSCLAGVGQAVSIYLAYVLQTRIYSLCLYTHTYIYISNIASTEIEGLLTERRVLYSTDMDRYITSGVLVCAIVEQQWRRRRRSRRGRGRRRRVRALWEGRKRGQEILLLPLSRLSLGRLLAS